MITEEAPYNIEDNGVFKAEFWENNQELLSDVRDQWGDEIEIEIEELRTFQPPTDIPNLTEFLRDLQNPP